MDAAVDICHLKEQMVKCYRNQEKYRQMGREASGWALKTWSLDRIRREFTRAMEDFRMEGVV
jgi:hypothetical protein